MRSESPLKKQPATEEMHMEPDGETAGAKAAEDKPTKKASPKRVSKKKSDA